MLCSLHRKTKCIGTARTIVNAPKRRRSNFGADSLRQRVPHFHATPKIDNERIANHINSGIGAGSPQANLNSRQSSMEDVGRCNATAQSRISKYVKNLGTYESAQIAATRDSASAHLNCLR